MNCYFETFKYQIEKMKYVCKYVCKYQIDKITQNYTITQNYIIT